MKGIENKIENFIMHFCRNLWYAYILKWCTDIISHSEKSSGGGPEEGHKRVPRNGRNTFLERTGWERWGCLTLRRLWGNLIREYNLSSKKLKLAGRSKTDATYFWQWIWKTSCQGKSVSKTSCYPAYTKAPPVVDYVRSWQTNQRQSFLSLFSWRTQSAGKAHCHRCK